MPSSIKLTEPLDILVEYGYLDEDKPYHKALNNAVMDFAEDPSLGGEYNKDYVMLLQEEAKKELKLRRKKINVKSFKEKFLNKKEEPLKADAKGAGALATIDKPSDLSKPDPVEEKETEGLKGIRDVLDDILKVLRLDFKGDRKEARDMQKEDQMKKRTKKEDKLEGGVKKSVGLIGKSLKAIVSPFSEIWDAVINFLKFTLIGVLFNKTLNWFGDPKNQKKAERIGKFFKDWWPALATAAALWLTPLGALLKGVVGLLTAIIPKLVIAIAANPYAALALVGTGLAVYGISKLASGMGGDKEGENLAEAQNQSSEQLQDEGMGAGEAEVLSQSVTTSNVNRMTEGDTNIRSNTNMLQTGMNDPLGGNSMGRYNGGGLVNDQTSAKNFVQKYNKGGEVPGSGNTDTVPAMLTPGEFVMSKGAVQKYGVDTLESMNLKGGGNNKPERKVGANKVGANKGGLINNYNNTLMKYQGGGAVKSPVKSVGEADSRIIIEIIKKTTNKNMKPVGVPIPAPKNTTITLPTIPKQKTEEETTTSKNEIPKFRVSMLSTQRSMVISTLGISDLIGG